MNHDFIDRYSHLDSVLHRRDPRAKIVAVLIAVVAIASTPQQNLHGFPYFYSLIGVLVVVSRIPARFIASRCALASPFIVMAALLPFLSLWMERGLGSVEAPSTSLLADPRAGPLAASVLLKAYAAIVLLTLLTSTSRFDQLLWALRRLRAPEILNVIATLMYRYVFILLEEWRRASRARAVRTPRGIEVGRIGLFGKQIGQVFLRGWERAERVQAAMTVRGFTGQLPVRHIGSFRAADAIFVGVLVLSFVSIRVFAR